VLGAQQQPVVLRDTALAIWDAFTGPTTVESVAELLAETYNTGADQIRDEVRRVVETLVDLNALAPVGTTG
jgi:hypothetical protein